MLKAFQIAFGIVLAVSILFGGMLAFTAMREPTPQEKLADEQAGMASRMMHEATKAASPPARPASRPRP
jgi:hypothetical protein